MHVAFVITRGDAVGGATVHVRDMAMALGDRGHGATVLIGDGEVSEQFAGFGIPVRTVSRLRRAVHPVRDALAVAQIVNILRDVKPDLVSTHTAKAGLLGRIAARIAGLPAIFTPHGWSIADRISPMSGKVFRVAERAAAPLAHTIVNVCEAERRLAESHRIATPSKLAVIHNGVVDLPRSLRADPRRNPPQLVMVARFEPPKDHATLLAALAGLRDAPWGLQLVGGGPGENDARRLADSLQLRSRVEFTGSAAGVSGLMAKAQAFVLVSRSEGFPRSILEAMRAGLPVVASDVGGVSEAVQNGVTGIVVPRDNPAALRLAIGTLITSPDLRSRMGTAARRRYESAFTFEHMFQKTFSLYQEVLRAGPQNMFTASRGVRDRLTGV